MSNVDLKFRTLRVNLRNHGGQIADDVFKRHHPNTENPKPEICIFCTSSTGMTKEHILPKWLIETELHNTMTSGINRQTQSYNKAFKSKLHWC